MSLIPYVPNSYYIFDRAYDTFKELYKIHLTGSYYVVRAKTNLKYKTVKWKRERIGSTALLLKGARRVGKSTVAKAFAENEYKSYILIDFVQAFKEVKQLFDNLMDLNYIFNSHKSLDEFCQKFSDRIEKRYLLYTKDFKKDGQTLLVPIYMTPLL